MSRFLKYCLGALFLLSLLALPWIPLHNDDSAMYAVAIRNAVDFGHWLVPLITPGDLHSFLDKPPLGIWLQALVPALVGVNFWSIHIMNILLYGLMTVMIWLFVKRWANRDIATFSALIFGTNLAMIIYSRTPKMEMLLLLCILAVHMLGYELLRNPKHRTFYFLLGFAAAMGFLVKSGLAFIIPLMTILSLMLNPVFRRKIGALQVSLVIRAGLISLIIIPLVLLSQSALLGADWPDYFQSLFKTSKYNSDYLKVGFHIESIGLFLAALLPWSGIVLSSLNIKKCFKGWGLRSFSMSWLLGTSLFLFFLYGQIDLRTMVMLVPPVSILGGYQLHRLFEHRGKFVAVKFATGTLGTLFALFALYTLQSPIYVRPLEKTVLVLASLIIATVQGILFALSEKFNRPFFQVAVIIIILGFGGLMVFSKPIAGLFNPYVTWCETIKKYRADGYSWVIYRPADRPLIMSSDLCYIDFIAGPADHYITRRTDLLTQLSKEKTVVLVDTRVKKRETLPLISIKEDKEQFLGTN